MGLLKRKMKTLVWLLNLQEDLANCSTAYITLVSEGLDVVFLSLTEHLHEQVFTPD